MCETGKNIKLCTCLAGGNPEPIIHHKNSKRHKKKQLSSPDKVYRWTLYKYAGLQERSMDGLLIEPSYKLSEYLTAETVLADLNNETCFDFEYKPNEGDNLEIYADGESGFLSFIYRDGQWKTDSYDCFVHKKEKINYGKLVRE